MKKQIDTDRLTNELKGSSLFFYPKPAPTETPPSAAPATKQPTPPAPPAISIPDKQQQNTKHSIKPENQQRTNAASPDIGDGFDINAAREARGTFELTEQEYDAISEIKRPLGRKFGVRITLHDIVRCAINQTLADYHEHGDESFLIRHLKHKQAN